MQPYLPYIIVAIVILYLVVSRARAAKFRISGEEARRLVKESGATLIDVRTSGEFSGGHIPAAKNIPLQTLGTKLKKIPKDKPVVVCCASGMRSAQAARMLTAEGYEVSDLGSWARW
ncbi:MAG: rhodanese-like domain-containing protein [Myxococcales bacterium]|nr:rhodanese-like domain-containing protein [Myxococcales bacterium]